MAIKIENYTLVTTWPCGRRGRPVDSREVEGLQLGAQGATRAQSLGQPIRGLSRVLDGSRGDKKRIVTNRQVIIMGVTRE